MTSTTTPVATPSAEPLAQPLNLITTDNLVPDKPRVDAEGKVVGFSTPYFAVTEITCTATALTDKTSDVHIYCDDSSGRQVADIVMQPEAHKSVTVRVGFAAPIQIAKIRMFSWWNPARIENVQFTLFRHATTRNLVSGQQMHSGTQIVPVTPPLYYANAATYAMKAATSATSNAFYYLDDLQGRQVAELNTQPENFRTSEGRSFLLPPTGVKQVRLNSWWNPAAAERLVLDYIPTSMSLNFANGQRLGPAGLALDIRCDYVVAIRCAAQAATHLASDVHFYLDDPAGKEVADVVMQPIDNQTSETTFYFAQPVSIRKARLFSWWNHAFARRLELIYLSGAL